MTLGLFRLDFILMDGDKVFTDTRGIAMGFKRNHKDVLKSYDRLDCSDEFNRRNFAPVTYVDEKGEARRAVQMTKDGFMFLVMGFTGKKAAALPRRAPSSARVRFSAPG
jgi:Rha family phage regulatory protein